MSERVNKTYRPSELSEVLELLENNKYHSFATKEAIAIVKMFMDSGYRIVKVTK